MSSLTLLKEALQDLRIPVGVGPKEAREAMLKASQTLNRHLPRLYIQFNPAESELISTGLDIAQAFTEWASNFTARHRPIEQENIDQFIYLLGQIEQMLRSNQIHPEQIPPAGYNRGLKQLRQLSGQEAIHSGRYTTPPDEAELLEFVTRNWPKVLTDFANTMRKGEAPSDPQGAELAWRWQKLRGMVQSDSPKFSAIQI